MISSPPAAAAAFTFLDASAGANPALRRVALTRHGVASRLVRTLTETYFPTHMHLPAPRGTL